MSRVLVPTAMGSPAKQSAWRKMGEGSRGGWLGTVLDLGDVD